MKTSLVILAVCTFATAMVPRERRALNSEEVAQTTTSTDKPKEICALQTPCGWSPYKVNVRVIEVYVPNTYCVCSVDTECQVNEDDSISNVYIHRCRPPLAADAVEDDALES